MTVNANVAGALLDRQAGPIAVAAFFCGVGAKHLSLPILTSGSVVLRGIVSAGGQRCHDQDHGRCHQAYKERERNRVVFSW